MPSSFIPLLILSKYFEYLFCTKSLSTNLDIKKHNVDPIELAKEVKITPGIKPKSAPAKTVLIAAKGNANAVTMM